jgi:hypothetical protein
MAERAQEDMHLENGNEIAEQPRREIILSPEFLALTVEDLGLDSFAEDKAENVSKKARQTGRNWFVVIHDPGESLDFLGALLLNTRRFKFGIWQYVKAKETLFIQGYVECNDSITIGRLKKIFSDEGVYEIRKCSRTVAVDRCTKAEGRIKGPYTFGRLNKKSVSNMGGCDSSELMKQLNKID